MTYQQQEFGYSKIVLHKSQHLGTGSYGKVCLANCDELSCAAKIFDLRDPGTTSYIQKFEKECQLLSLARHPNIVQYFATYCDPETHLPVLLMELCDENLCMFLERSRGPLPYHIQLNIIHDIALALAYLHSNVLIHGDLTGNNVLVIAGVRAKVTDFGMSKLTQVNPCITLPNRSPLCQGNVHYLSPEAFEEPPSFTDKLDIFSFGVLQVQIMTRQFPKPTPRFQMLDLRDDTHFQKGTVRVAVPEMQRRSAHLQLISSAHPLKALALNCLKDIERERCSAQQLSGTLSELKQAPQYVQSVQQAQTGEGSGLVAHPQQRFKQHQQDIEQLQQKLHGQQTMNKAKMREIQKLQNTVQDMEKELQKKNHIIQTKEKDLQDSKKLVANLQLTIKDLRQTISAYQVSTSSGQLQQLTVTADVQQASTSAEAQSDISKMRWKEGKRAPEKMRRGAAVVSENTAYINPHDSHKIYACQIISGEEQWSTLPDSSYACCSLAIVEGHLTTIGGRRGVSNTKVLLSLNSEKEWSEVLPRMRTARSLALSIATARFLVVAGGFDGENDIGVVEVMNIRQKVWMNVGSLPYLYSTISGTICGDYLYLGGGYSGDKPAPKMILRCPLVELVTPQSVGAFLRTYFVDIWQEIKDLPVALSTLITLGDHLIAVGGKDDSENPSDEIHRYDQKTDSWHCITKMKNKRCLSLSAVLPENQLLIVGGAIKSLINIDSVEIGSLSMIG